MSIVNVAILKSLASSLVVPTGVTLQEVTSEEDCQTYTFAILPWAQRGSNAFRTARAVFVLLADTERADELWTDPKVIGFGRQGAPETWQEAWKIIDELQTRFHSQEQELPLLAPNSLDSLFVSHFRGVMRDFYRDLHDILHHIPLLTQNSDADPFRGIAPTQWLNFYGHKKTGAFIKPEEAEELNRLMSKKVGKKGEETFEHIFFGQGVVSPPPKPILILGETGAGKTVVARMIHRHLEQKRRTERAVTPPLTQINCAGLGDLLESELFGAMVGAYTGADVTNPGKIVASYGGILFLDELGTMSPKAQAKLLTYLDRGEVVPQGWSGPPLRVPVQIVAATNADLLAEVQKGKFRADLYYRFEQRLRIPPLRERGDEELRLLIQHLLNDPTVNPQHVSGQRAAQKISQGALAKLLRHDYPGNHRELQSLLQTAVKKATRLQDTVIRTSDIEFEKSPLPPQHSVIAVIKKRERDTEWFLLRFNPYWLQYFLIGGRFEAHHQTFENALREELHRKIVLSPDHYLFKPAEVAQEIRLIQYSERDQQLKHYLFHLYGVTLKNHSWSEADLQARGLIWVTMEHIMRERGPFGERISRTVKEIADRAGRFTDDRQFPVSK